MNASRSRKPVANKHNKFGEGQPFIVAGFCEQIAMERRPARPARVAAQARPAQQSQM